MCGVYFELYVARCVLTVVVRASLVVVRCTMCNNCLLSDVCWLLCVAVCVSLLVGDLLFGVDDGCLVFVVCFSMCTVCCDVCVVCGVLFVARRCVWWPLFAVCWLLCVVIVCCLVFGDRCALLVTVL